MTPSSRHASTALAAFTSQQLKGSVVSVYEAGKTGRKAFLDVGVTRKVGETVYPVFGMLRLLGR